MGSLYRPKYSPTGMTYTAAKAAGELRESAVWWVKYRANGRILRESTDTTDHAEAKRFLKKREGAAADGRPIVPRADRVLVRELAEDLKANHTANGRRLDRLAYARAHLDPYFGDRKAAHVLTADVTRYVAQRLEAGAANGTINRELGILARMYALGRRNRGLQQAPLIEKLQDHNVRKGFFERDAFESVRRHLPERYRGIVTVAYITGWRMASEILPLTWRQVDFKAGTVRLEPGTTKNREGRMFYLTPELRATLEGQRGVTEALQKKRGSIIPWVFHRKTGKPIRGFRKSWAKACRAAGVPGRIPHDFRRTAVRNLERAGVPRSAAMKMVGHKTEAIYRRYAIVDDVMLREGSEKLARLEAIGQRTGQSGELQG